MALERDYIERRIVVEFGRRYVYARMETDEGKVVGEALEIWKQPYTLTRAEAHEDAKGTWDYLWDWINDTVVFPLPDQGRDQADSEKED
jgi:hypothetical protein